ncbi:MAG: MFS transporter, partial [Bacilli bacterium]
MINKFRSFFNTFHPVVITLFLGTMMSRMATSMSLPFMAIYLSINTDMNPLLIGITVGVGPLTSTLVGFIGGSISDRIGRKIVMLGALFTWSVVFIGFAVVDQTWMFIVLSMLNGACKSCFEPVSQALMIDLTPKDLRYRVFSIRYTAANLGFAVGPMVGAFLGIAGGTVPFVTTGVFFFLYACTLSIL